MEYACHGKTLTFIKPLVMAIVNLTPDSFYDGGKYGSTADVIRDAGEKLKSGAKIIDIGAASSRPGAQEISEAEEWQRLEDALKQLRRTFPEVFISVDTYRSSIALRCAEEGADIINDISGGKFDKNMLDTVARINLPYVMMHIQGNPGNMQENPHYENVVMEVRTEFERKAAYLNGFGFSKIILDPGFGFGKNNLHNYSLLKNLSVFCNLGYPVLAGVSRKSMVNKIIHTNPVTALNGTTVLNTLALLNGANILRVHDVPEAQQAIELVEYYKSV